MELTFVIKSLIYHCLSYLIPSHAVLLAERPAIFKPVQTGLWVASCSTAELHCVGSWHRMQLLLHLCWRGPIRSTYNQITGGVQSIPVWLQGPGQANSDIHRRRTKLELFLTHKPPPPNPLGNTVWPTVCKTRPHRAHSAQLNTNTRFSCELYRVLQRGKEHQL